MKPIVTFVSRPTSAPAAGTGFVDATAWAAVNAKQARDFIAAPDIILKLVKIRREYTSAMPPVIGRIKLLLDMTPPFYAIQGHLRARQLQHPGTAVHKGPGYLGHGAPVKGTALNL